jgi:hypothetical protein
LPIPDHSVDLLCYFGILHHTEEKEKNLLHHQRYLKPDGIVVLSEALERPSIKRNRNVEKSAHEERIDFDALKRIIEKYYMVLSGRLQHSVLLTAAMSFKIVIRSRFLFSVISIVDRGCIKILGSLLPWFRPGEYIAILKQI